MRNEKATPKGGNSKHLSISNSQAKTQANPRWIMSVRDLPANRAPARYEAANEDGTMSIVTLDKGKRQVVDALLIGPLYCASTVRLGDAIFRSKQDHDLHAATETTPEDRNFYALNGKVRRIDGGGSTMIATASPIHIVTPIAGTIRWSASGQNLGVWGKDFPVKPLDLLSTVDVRDLSPAEAKLYQHTGVV